MKVDTEFQCCFPDGAQIASLLFSEDGKTLFVTSLKGHIAVLNATKNGSFKVIKLLSTSTSEPYLQMTPNFQYWCFLSDTKHVEIFKSADLSHHQTVLVDEASHLYAVNDFIYVVCKNELLQMTLITGSTSSIMVRVLN